MRKQDSHGYGKEVTSTEIQNCFRKNECSNQKQNKDLPMYKNHYMYARDQIFQALAMVYLSSRDNAFGVLEIQDFCQSCKYKDDTQMQDEEENKI